MAPKYDTTAPGFEPDAVGLPWYRRSIAQGLGYFGPGVLFLGIPLWFARDIEPSRFAVLVALVAFEALVYLGTSLTVSWPHAARWVWLALLIAAQVAMAALAGDFTPIAYYTIYTTVTAAMLLPWVEARIFIIGAGLVSLGLGASTGDAFAVIMAITGTFLGFSIGFGMEAGATRRKLAVEEERTAVLAVAAERARIGRDLHDILGHSLTTIAVKADLARRLVDRDPARAASEIDELAGVARQALADVRATASGMREVRLASEIASARSVRAAAGIDAHVPTAVDAADDATSELLGYVVREAVTNVVRHSGAASCTIAATRHSVTVSDDGRGWAGVPGNGLAGLRARVAEGGGVLAIDSGRSGTRVKADLSGGAA